MSFFESRYKNLPMSWEVGSRSGNCGEITSAATYIVSFKLFPGREKRKIILKPFSGELKIPLVIHTILVASDLQLTKISYHKDDGH